MNQRLQHCVAHVVLTLSPRAGEFVASLVFVWSFILALFFIDICATGNSAQPTNLLLPLTWPFRQRAEGNIFLIPSCFRQFDLHSNPNLLRRKLSDCDNGISELEFVFLPNIHV